MNITKLTNWFNQNVYLWFVVPSCNDKRVHQVVKPDKQDRRNTIFNIITDGLVNTDDNHQLITNKEKTYSVEYLQWLYWSEKYRVLAGLDSFEEMIHLVLNKQVVNINTYCDYKSDIK